MPTVLRRRLTYWLLAALLVIGQTVLLVHRSDIDAHAHGERCTVCVLVHGLDHAVSSHFEVPFSGLETPTFVATSATTSNRQANNHYPARAPPSNTLPG